LEDFSNINQMRSLARTKETKEKSFGVSYPLTEFYDLPGLNPHQDWPYEILHGALLGYVKYLWRATIKTKPIKRDLEKLALCFDGLNKDKIEHMLTGKQVLCWSGSFNGRDFRTLVQLWPSTLLAFYRCQECSDEVKKLIKLWFMAGRLTRLLYMPSIGDLDDWCLSVNDVSNNLLRLWIELWGFEDIRAKTKLHHLFHIPMWARRFGPPLAGNAEVNEAANKKIRRQLELTNRKAGSRDLAFKATITAGLQFLAQGGIWAPANSEKMTRPGRALRKLCREERTRKHIGLPPLTDEGGFGVLTFNFRGKVGDGLVSKSDLRKWGIPYHPSQVVEYLSFSRFSTSDPKLKGGIGSAILLKDRPEKLFRIVNILRTSPNTSMQSFFVLEEFVLETSPDDGGLIELGITLYKRKRDLFHTAETCLLGAVVNVQHVCTVECDAVDSPVAYRMEREVVSGYRWKHAGDGRWMINPNMLCS
jgi:hypothetical protein